MPRGASRPPARMSLRPALGAVLAALSISACAVPRLSVDEVRRELGQGRNLADRNMRGLALAGFDFRNANLQRAILREANLEGADLTAADLTKADLVQARLAGATLRGANLREANFERANLDGADLAGAVMVGADLEDANLTGANLQGVDLTDADMRDVILERADLSDAVLVNAWLEDAKLGRARLLRANLSEGRLSSADLTEAILDGADLRDADLEDANLRNASLVGAKLARADLRKANLEGADLDDADLTGAQMEEAHLHGASLQGTRLEGAKLRGATTRGSALTQRLPAPPSEVLRAQLGTIGVVTGGARTAGEFRSLDKRALAAGQGAMQGMMGPGSYGALSMLAMAGMYGVFFPPLLVVTIGVAAVSGGLGAAVGAVTAEGPPPAIQANVATLRSAGADLRLDDTLRDQVTEAGSRQTRHPFVVLPTGTTFGGGAAFYPPLPPHAADTILETTLLGLALVSDSYEEPPALVVAVGFRLGRAKDASPAYEGALAYTSRRRPLTEWASEQGRPFREEVDRATRSLSERIVDELFLVYAP